MPMRKGDVIRHALNIVELMDAVSDALVSNLVHPSTDPLIRPHIFSAFEAGEVDETPDRPAQLSDIGLDDMGIQRIVIELSTDRSHFKIWSPYNENFVAAIKRSIPKHARSWDKDERCWRVDTYWFGNAQQLLPNFYPDMERFYTDRAMRMCEQLAKDYEKEEFDRDGPNGGDDEEAPPPKKQKKPKKKPDKKRPKSRSQEGRFVDDEEPEPRTRKSRSNGSRTEDDPYSVLGVSPEAPDEVVKAAHKALARMFHSDLAGGGDPKRMAKINSAFETIKEQRGWTNK